MSFDYNPFKHFEILESDFNPEYVMWHCHSCGADSERRKSSTQNPDPSGIWHTSTPVAVIIAAYKAHIRTSHGRTPKDFEDWSKW